MEKRNKCWKVFVTFQSIKSRLNLIDLVQSLSQIEIEKKIYEKKDTNDLF